MYQNRKAPSSTTLLDYLLIFHNLEENIINKK